MQRKRAQRRVVRRHKGSNRRCKAVTILAKAHAKVRRTRQDFHHKTATRPPQDRHKTALALVRPYDTISHEDVQTANLLRNHHLAQAIADAGWSAILRILSRKAAAAGKTVVAVPPAHTSHVSAGVSCGVLVHTGLSVRWHACPACGTSLHRDHNAARTSLRLGTERRGAGQAPQAQTQPNGAYVA
jgi:putative transposase